MSIDWQLTIDCARPAPLVRFWAVALGYVPPEPPAGHASWRDYYISLGEPDSSFEPDDDGADRLVDPAGLRPPIWFQVVPESKSVKNRLHLDLRVGGGRAVPVAERRTTVDDKVAALVDAGATLIRTTDDTANNHYAVLLADPEGNEFCVV
jgi:hypothetical protein